MTATAAEDNVETRAGRSGFEYERAALGHLLTSTAFLVLAGLLITIAVFELRFPSTFSGFLAYGRVRVAAVNAAALGWLTLGLVGGIYYVLPRLTGTRLAHEGLARLNLGFSLLVYLVATVTPVAGWAVGRGALGLPVWASAAVIATLFIPLYVTISTIRNRNEPTGYPTLWYVTTGLVWLLGAAVVGSIPGLSTLATTLQRSFATNGIVMMWIIGAGTGLTYYALHKASGTALKSRSLAFAGFWSLAVAGAWAGQARVIWSGPEWLASVASTASVAVLVAALITAYNLLAGLGDQWSSVSGSPVLRAAVSGTVAYLGLSALATAGSFRAAGSVIGFTTFWDGVDFGFFFVVGGLWLAAITYQALPNLTGREVFSDSSARTHVRLTLIGGGGTAFLLVVGGALAGFTWTGGANSGAFVSAGEGWAATTGAIGIVYALAAFTAVLAFLGQLTYALNVYRTVTSGTATEVEVLVEREDPVKVAPEAIDNE